MAHRRPRNFIQTQAHTLNVRTTNTQRTCIHTHALHPHAHTHHGNAHLQPESLNLSGTRIHPTGHERIDSSANTHDYYNTRTQNTNAHTHTHTRTRTDTQTHILVSHTLRRRICSLAQPLFTRPCIRTHTHARTLAYACASAHAFHLACSHPNRTRKSLDHSQLLANPTQRRGLTGDRTNPL